MEKICDAVDDMAGSWDLFVDEVDLIGLYRPDIAAAASRATACDPGSGPTQIDD
jgi:hypothetical protein